MWAKPRAKASTQKIKFDDVDIYDNESLLIKGYDQLTVYKRVTIPYLKTIIDINS